MIVVGAAGCGVDSADGTQDQTSDEVEVAGPAAEQADTAPDPTKVDEDIVDADGNLMRAPLAAEQVDENSPAAATTNGFFELAWRIGGPRYFSCAKNTSGSALRLNHTPYFTNNGCFYRVWLYSQSNHTGYRRCVSPHSAAFLNLPYKSFVVTANTTHC
jgi:hypothetical protein